MKARTFKIGGIHLPENKFTDASRIITVELPMSVTVPMSQHIGAPATPIVKRGDTVVRGQKIAEAAGKVSAPVHAPISGTVKVVGPTMLTSGQMGEAITIEADEASHAADEADRNAQPEHRDYSAMSPKELVDAIADAGIVGMGGATFPTAMKLSPPPGSKVEVIIINASECEPYLTCDDALMRAFPDEIVEGIEIIIRATGAPRAVIGIEANKPEAYSALSQAIEGHPKITLMPLQCRYPEGGEKQLINAVTGREVKSGALPISVGAIVQNVATAHAIYKAVALGQPLIERVITVASHGNYLVPVGMKINQLPIEADTVEEADVIVGGPMMGRSAATLDAPVTKGTSGITVIAPTGFDPDPCIRCGECVQACPMGLQPYLISTLGRLKRSDEAKEEGAMDCLECGCCNYSCPSGRPILDYIRYVKGLIRSKK